VNTARAPRRRLSAAVAVVAAAVATEITTVHQAGDSLLPFPTSWLVAAVAAVAIAAGLHLPTLDRLAPAPPLATARSAAGGALLIYVAVVGIGLAAVWALSSGGAVDEATRIRYDAGDLIGTGLVPAFAEEAIFRVVLLGALAAVMPLRLAVVAQAVMFGIAHTGLGYLAGFGDPTRTTYNVAAAIESGVAGLGYAAVVVATGRLWPAIALHALGNVLVVLDDVNRPAAVNLTVLLAVGAFLALLDGLHALVQRWRPPPDLQAT